MYVPVTLSFSLFNTNEHILLLLKVCRTHLTMLLLKELGLTSPKDLVPEPHRQDWRGKDIFEERNNMKAKKGVLSFLCSSAHVCVCDQGQEVVTSDSELTGGRGLSQITFNASLSSKLAWIWRHIVTAIWPVFGHLASHLACKHKICLVVDLLPQKRYQD